MVELGIDRLLADPPAVVEDARLGVITNPSGVNSALEPTLDLLAADDAFDLRVAFGPEHGVRGDRQAGEEFDDTVDEATGVTVKSLYGDTRRLAAADVAELDVVVCDLQGVGCRFYTYLYTLAYALEGVAGTDTSLVVLDRPNPIAPLPVAGNRIPDEHATFVGGYRLPIVYGLTIGEFVAYVRDMCDVNADLHVVEMQDWNREMWFEETGLHWVQPSPNIPTLTAAILYPGTCLFEGTNLSEGRGTTKPFTQIGAPWIDPFDYADRLEACDVAGVSFRPTYFTPWFSKHEETRTGGVEIHIDDRDRLDPVDVGLLTLVVAFSSFPECDWRQRGNRYVIDRLAGGPWLREHIDSMEPAVDPAQVVASIRSTWEAEEASFSDVIEDVALY